MSEKCHLTPEYIITEVQLEIFERIAGNLSNLASKVRSRPYQSERDKLLDELLKFLYNANKKRFTLHELLQKMGELRQKAGE